MPLIKLKFLVYIVLKLIAILDNVTQSCYKFYSGEWSGTFLENLELELCHVGIYFVMNND